MRAAADSFYAQQAADAAAARALKIKPLTDLLGSDTWTAFRTAIAAAETAAQGEVFFDQVRALNLISGNLAGQVASATAPTAT